MKILITGTHFTPAQAVIEELKKDESVEIVYVGRGNTMEGDTTPSVESKILPELGVKFIPLIAGRLRKDFSFWTIISLFKVPIGFVQSLFIIIFEKPDVVLSFGGYVGVPVVINSWFLNVPIILHEQTLVSGLSNTLSSLFADKIAVSFNSKYDFSKDKTILVGSPIRKELLDFKNNEISEDVKTLVNLASREKLPLILITGGNQGSHIINLTVEQVLSEILTLGVLVHQTGDSKFNDYERLLEKSSEKYLVRKWIDAKDFGYLLSNTDLAISRSGVNTLVELAYFGIPTIVVPIPNLYKNEQEKNAQFFAELGLAQKISQNQFSFDKLLKIVRSSLKDINKLKTKAKNVKKSVVILDAAKRLALETKILGDYEI